MYTEIGSIMWLGLLLSRTVNAVYPGLGLSFIVMFMTASSFIHSLLPSIDNLPTCKKTYITTCKLAQMQMRSLGCLASSSSLTCYSGQSILVEPGKWFAFLNKRPQRGARWPRGNELGTLRRDIQI